jgi:hypothetical protein
VAEGISFKGKIRHWRADPPGGLAVIDIPNDLVEKHGGRRQLKVSGTLNGSTFSGSTMLVAGGGYCVGVSKAVMKAAGTDVGKQVDVQLARLG